MSGGYGYNYNGGGAEVTPMNLNMNMNHSFNNSNSNTFQSPSHNASSGMSNSPSNTSGGGRRTAYDEQTLSPITIQMALAAQSQSSSNTNTNSTPTRNDEELYLSDGRKLHTVKLIGAIRAVNEQSTNILYEVEDGTGLIDVKKWMDHSDNSALQAMRMECKEHTYVRVIGQLKEYEGRKSLMAFSVRKLSTPNEITHHFLEVVYSAEKYKQSLQQQGGTAGGMEVTSSSSYQHNTPQGGGAGPAFSNSNNSSNNPMREKIIQYIQHHGADSEVGTKVAPMLEQFSAQYGYSHKEMRDHLDSLCNEGMIYSTVDEESFKFAT